MPEGIPLRQDVLLPEPVEEVRRHLLMNVAPSMDAVRYRLSNTEDRRVVFSRRYLPRDALVLGLVVVAIVGVIQSSNGGQTTPALVLGWVAVLAMLFYRRTEAVTLDLQAEHGETRVMAIGHASKQATKVLNEALFDRVVPASETATDL